MYLRTLFTNKDLAVIMGSFAHSHVAKLLENMDGMREKAVDLVVLSEADMARLGSKARQLRAEIDACIEGSAETNNCSCAFRDAKNVIVNVHAFKGLLQALTKFPEKNRPLINRMHVRALAISIERWANTQKELLNQEYMVSLLVEHLCESPESEEDLFWRQYFNLIPENFRQAAYSSKFVPPAEVVDLFESGAKQANVAKGIFKLAQGGGGEGGKEGGKGLHDCKVGVMLLSRDVRAKLPNNLEPYVDCLRQAGKDKRDPNAFLEKTITSHYVIATTELVGYLDSARIKYVVNYFDLKAVLIAMLTGCPPPDGFYVDKDGRPLEGLKITMTYQWRCLKEGSGTFLPLWRQSDMVVPGVRDKPTVDMGCTILQLAVALFGATAAHPIAEQVRLLLSALGKYRSRSEIGLHNSGRAYLLDRETGALVLALTGGSAGCFNKTGFRCWTMAPAVRKVVYNRLGAFADTTIDLYLYYFERWLFGFLKKHFGLHIKDISDYFNTEEKLDEFVKEYGTAFGEYVVDKCEELVVRGRGQTRDRSAFNSINSAFGLGMEYTTEGKLRLRAQEKLTFRWQELEIRQRIASERELSCFLSGDMDEGSFAAMCLDMRRR